MQDNGGWGPEIEIHQRKSRDCWQAGGLDEKKRMEAL